MSILVRALAIVVSGSTVACAATPRAVLPNDGHDPTPLAKCSVAASKMEPLVTEWPASSKARLEALIAEGAVAVAYSGCELRIVDTCKPKGSYRWSRTTLSTDTTEIRSEDELYAKLPLGATSLEGDLRRAGRLSVTTTVSGQMKLVDATDTAGTEGCAEATHFVTALSVGAFKLTAGGMVSASGGVGVGGAGAGGRTASAESVMHEAGDPRACSDATDASPSASCRSPLQIFLQPIPRNDVATVRDRDASQEPSPTMRPSRTWGWVLAGLGLASVAAGTYFMISSADQKSKIRNGGYATGSDIDAAAQSSAMSGNFAIGFLAAGGVGIVASIPFFIWGGDAPMVPVGAPKAASR